MAKRLLKHRWQFYVTDAAEIAAGDGAACFERHARELAQTLGCQLVTYKDLSLEQIGAQQMERQRDSKPG